MRRWSEVTSGNQAAKLARSGGLVPPAAHRQRGWRPRSSSVESAVEEPVQRNQITARRRIVRSGTVPVEVGYEVIDHRVLVFIADVRSFRRCVGERLGAVPAIRAYRLEATDLARVLEARFPVHRRR